VGRYLEGDADITTISIRDLFPDLTLPSTAQDNSRARTLRHETRRFQVCLLQVDIPTISTHVRRTDKRTTLLRNLVHLENLSLDKVVDNTGDELDDFTLSKTRKRRTRPAEQKVTPEDGVLVPKGNRRGQCSTTQVGAINDVVVQQRRDMYHLDDLREPRLGG